MYRQIYTLPFQSIEENDYLVVIEKDGFTGTSTELIGASSPFTIETSLDNPFSPYRLSTATLKIFGGDYLQNLFTPNPQGVRVKLLKNGIVEWIGFVTNDTYSQDYSNEEFEYEIELVNPLSTLKHRKFVYGEDIISFYQLIIESIKATNSEIKKLYLPTHITNSLNQNIYELIFTASQNYIDEQDEEMTYYDILEEIAKYLSLTITIDKDKVYFLDYVGTSKGYNSYYEYTFSSNYNVTKNPSAITLSNSNTVQLLDYSGDSSRLQINSGKNKAKVTCSLYDINEILPAFNDEKSKFIKMKDDFSQTVDKKKYTGIIRYFEQPKFTFWRYPLIDSEGVETNKPISNNEAGSTFVKTTNYKSDEIPTKLNLTNEVQVRSFVNKTGAQSGKHLTTNSPIFRVSSEKNILISPDIWFCISFSVKFNTQEWRYKDSDSWKVKSFGLGQKVTFRIGDWYYNGTTWIDSPTWFYMSIDQEENMPFFGTYFNIKNTNTFDKGIGNLNGYTFKAPDSMVYGKCELTIYNFADTPRFELDDNGLHYSYYKDIEVAYGIPNEQSIYNDWKDTDSDIIYENVIDDEYVEEADEIELKICTFPENYNKLCYSATFIDNQFLSVLKYIPLNLTDKPEVIIIKKIVDYYTNPKYQVSIPVINKPLYPYTLITDINLSGKRFIYAGNEIDYEFEKNNITLIEI